MEHEVETRTCGLGVGRIGRLVEQTSNPSEATFKPVKPIRQTTSRSFPLRGFPGFRVFQVIFGAGFFCAKGTEIPKKPFEVGDSYEKYEHINPVSFVF